MADRILTVHIEALTGFNHPGRFNSLKAASLKNLPTIEKVGEMIVYFKDRGGGEDPLIAQVHLQSTSGQVL